MPVRLSAIALAVVVAGSIGAGVVASARTALPAATCSLPGTIVCTVDAECTPYSAVCDTQASPSICVCASTDLGVDLGGTVDLAGGDLAATPDGSGGGTSGGPNVGGGMTGPLKRAGCSFVPGAR
ncbi:MAG TPA: hypothetical protein VF997_19180 [Polyangia bacterium]